MRQDGTRLLRSAFRKDMYYWCIWLFSRCELLRPR